MQSAFLLLQDGTIFWGYGLGYQGVSVGEVVFNTSMTGYQEITTDPSYAGQIVTFTYPLLGNYGINEFDFESSEPKLRGIVVASNEDKPSNFRSQSSLDDYLKKHKIIGITGIDTRKLTRKIRQYGVLPGAIVSASSFTESLKKDVLKKINGFNDQNVIAEVSCSKSYKYSRDNKTWPFPKKPSHSIEKKQRFKLVVMDFGIKKHILRLLDYHGFDITVAPYDASIEEIKAFKPQAIFLSNGPGDPKSIPKSINTIKELCHNYPTMGICLGQQLIALALGGDTYKLPFGHRGANHPVQDLRSRRVTITSQNHGYCVDPKSLEKTGLEISHINLNDKTPEGLSHKNLPIFCVQYHPEASPGPLDNGYLFEDFYEMVKKASLKKSNKLTK